MAATTATALPRPSLLDRKLKGRPSKVGIVAFLAALATGIAYIVFHVARDLDAASITSYAPYGMLGLALLIALGFEFVNGFHDTANAVATVIYTHSLEPNVAVVLSGICNLAGVLLSSGTVAFAVITLLPGMREWYWNLLISLPIAAAIAALSWHLIEKPVLSRKGILQKINDSLGSALVKAWPRMAKRRVVADG